MLRFDRYLVTKARAIDLASGHRVDVERPRQSHAEIALFQSRHGRTLIDLEISHGQRIEVWERWLAHVRVSRIDSIVTDFVEMLDCARLGAPRGFDLQSRHLRQYEFLQRVLAREARVRGWIPISVEVLGALYRRRQQVPSWLADRSLVVFAEAPDLSGDASLGLLRLAQRDARPHVVVRTLSRGPNLPRSPFTPAPPHLPMVHEDAKVYEAESKADPTASPCSGVQLAHRPRGAFVEAIGSGDLDPADPKAEAAARWQWLLARMGNGSHAALRAVQLARVLIARDQPFEARALAASVTAGQTTCSSEAAAVVSDIDQRASARASKGFEMVDDFVGVLQMCQEIEDEHTALARVSAYLRDRLQASSVAFVVRDGSASRVLTRIGSEVAGIDLALRTIQTGVATSPERAEGPAESAWPVRHAAEVIGAVWCRWSAGMPVASQQASALLGIAAAATAPSVRLALARSQPVAARGNPIPDLVGESAAIVAIREAILRAAASPFPVVIEGESGSGKELAARAIHSRSTRRERRFCAINCAALVDELVEAELFGHVRGAFTGASAERPGVFEDASGGTLFMDEIAELGAKVQAKLLRALQEGEIRRLGETAIRKVDVRVVAATNRPLAKEVAAGTFRADLWYRLDVIRITLPPLRERLDDLPLLVAHLWHALAARTGSRAVLSPAAIGALAAYDWPGNIRELQNALASLMVSAPRAGLIGPMALPSHIARVAALQRGATLAAARRQFEERYVRAALARAGGRGVIAARDLGLSRQGLAKLMGRLGIAELKRDDATGTNVQ